MTQNKQNSEVEAKKCISLLTGDISTYPYSHDICGYNVTEMWKLFFFFIVYVL